MEFLETMIEGLTFWKVFGFIFCSGVVVEVVPVIKWNPITSLLQWMGKVMTKELKDDLENVNKKVDLLQSDLQEHKVESWRKDIKCFSESLRTGSEKRKDQFDETFTLYDKYEKYIEERGMKNGEIDAAMKFINTKYAEHLANNSFYTGKQGDIDG